MVETKDKDDILKALAYMEKGRKLLVKGIDALIESGIHVSYVDVLPSSHCPTRRTGKLGITLLGGIKSVSETLQAEIVDCWWDKDIGEVEYGNALFSQRKIIKVREVSEGYE